MTDKSPAKPLRDFEYETIIEKYIPLAQNIADEIDAPTQPIRQALRAAAASALAEAVEGFNPSMFCESAGVKSFSCHVQSAIKAAVEYEHRAQDPQSCEAQGYVARLVKKIDKFSIAETRLPTLEAVNKLINEIAPDDIVGKKIKKRVREATVLYLTTGYPELLVVLSRLGGKPPLLCAAIERVGYEGGTPAEMAKALVNKKPGGVGISKIGQSLMREAYKILKPHSVSKRITIVNGRIQPNETDAAPSPDVPKSGKSSRSRYASLVPV